jgi:hypothetical protein
MNVSQHVQFFRKILRASIAKGIKQIVGPLLNQMDNRV